MDYSNNDENWVADVDKTSSGEAIPDSQKEENSITSKVVKLDLMNLCEEFQTMTFDGAAKSKCRKEVNEEMMTKLLSKFPKKIITITDTEIQKVYETAPTGPAGLKTNFTAPRRWLVRFFVNFFKGSNIKEERKGAQCDIDNAKIVFEKVLLYNNEDWNKKVVQRDKTVEEIRSTLKKIADEWPSYQCDGFICLFSSHGTKGNIFGADGKEISIENICTTLNVISDPKLLIIQACQGASYNHAEWSMKNMVTPLPPKVQNGVEVSDGVTYDLLAPKDHNFLLYYATTPNYVSLRHPTYGSVIFTILFHEIIQARIDLHEKCDCIDLHEMMTNVNQKMRKYILNGEEKLVKQMPTVVYTLTEIVKLLIRNDVSCTELKEIQDKIMPEKFKNRFVDYIRN